MHCKSQNHKLLSHPATNFDWWKLKRSKAWKKALKDRAKTAGTDKIEIKVEPNTGLLSSVKINGVELGDAVKCVTYVHTPKDWPTVAIEFTSNDISIEIPNAVKDAKPIKGIKIWRATPSSKEIRNLLSGKQRNLR